MSSYPDFKNTDDVLHIEIIQALRDTIEIKDPYTRGHSDRVSELSVLMAEKFHLPEEDLITLRIGGLFHDIGKIGMTDEVLSKRISLTAEEFSDIQRHPVIGEYILSKSPMFKNILPIVRNHHEKYDGSRLS
ncbi:MAG: HD domain-containing protein [Oscillospiraceae bacterium]|nr:HD domain-containing protein [Oscillospiraceae bacterium]